MTLCHSLGWKVWSMTYVDVGLAYDALHDDGQEARLLLGSLGGSRGVGGLVGRHLGIGCDRVRLR